MISFQFSLMLGCNVIRWYPQLLGHKDNERGLSTYQLVEDRNTGSKSTICNPG